MYSSGTPTRRVSYNYRGVHTGVAPKRIKREEAYVAPIFMSLGLGGRLQHLMPGYRSFAFVFTYPSYDEGNTKLSVNKQALLFSSASLSYNRKHHECLGMVRSGIHQMFGAIHRFFSRLTFSLLLLNGFHPH